MDGQLELGLDRFGDVTVDRDGRRLSDAQVIASYAHVTAEGLLFDFGGGRSFLLEGLTTTTGLAAVLDVF